MNFINREMIGPALMLVLFGGYAIAAWSIPLMPFEEMDAVNSATMPKVYSLIGLAAALLSLIAKAIKQQVEIDVSTISSASLGRCGILLLLMLGYALLMTPLGFVLATVLFLVIGMWALGERSIKVLLLASVPVVLFFWLVMTQLLGMFLEPGSWW